MNSLKVGLLAKAKEDFGGDKRKEYLVLPVFFLTLREGVEVALIVGIILAYLQRTDRTQYTKMVWLGMGSAIGVCALVGGLIFSVMGGYDSSVPAEKNALRIFEGVSCLLAAGVLTWVIVWMHRHARTIGSEIRAAVDAAVEKKQALSLLGLVFVTVGREGLETILILPGMSKGASTPEVFGGVALGLIVATVIGVAFARGSKVLDLQKFFTFSGVLLIFFAAGLVAYGVHELQDAGMFPVAVKDVWNINDILHEKKGFGLLLKSLFGYNGNPELIELIAYVGYLVTSLVLFLKPAKSEA